MKYPAYSLALIVLIGATSAAFGQGKGVDAQNQRITDTGNSRAAGNNGTKQDTGTTGSGITWGKDKTRTTNLLPNPYRVSGRRDVLLKAVADVMRERKLIVDDAASKPSEGIVISQPYTIRVESVCSCRDGRCSRLDPRPIHHHGRGTGD